MFKLGILDHECTMVAEGCHSEKNKQTKKSSMCFIKILYIKKLLIN